MMEKVSQRTEDDCVVCVLAMVMGPPYTYDKILQDSRKYQTTDNEGHTIAWWKNYLEDEGFESEAHSSQARLSAEYAGKGNADGRIKGEWSGSACILDVHMGRSDLIRWQSAGTYLELPLISISFGPDPLKNESHGRARGIIAIGDIATGVIAVGPLARGIVAVGGLAIGVLTVSLAVLA